MKDTVVLHLSDLHFGLGFADGKWSQLIDIFKKEPPSLIVVTGDVVNHPSRSALKHANKQLDEMRAALVDANHGQDIPLVIVPGNHDTRISGLVPLSWLLASSVILAAAAAAMYSQSVDYRWCLAVLLLAAIPAAVRMFCTNNLAKIFGKKLIVEPMPFHKLNLGIIPLDSSVARSCGAHGRVRDDVARILNRTFGDDRNRNLFWIAAVHHHPLPIPYDHAWEPTMLLKNAGTVLQNLVHHNIPLVLHGHKHHQHFSRLFLVDQTHGEREISVLSAGTATHKKQPTLKHSFNTITIDADHRARVAVYEAGSDGAFHLSPQFLVSSSEVYQKRRFEQYCSGHPISASRLISTISIDELGGAIWAEEFSALATKLPIRNFPYDFEVACKTGHIFSGESKADNGPPANALIRYKDKHTVLSNVIFNPDWQPGHAPFDYRLEYRILNFCALDSVQFENMYANGDENFYGDIEHINYSVPTDIAVNEFLIHLKFPHSVPLPEKIWFNNGIINGKNVDWLMSSNIELVRVHSASSVFVRINSPKPGALFQIKWKVAKGAEDANKQQMACESGLLAIDRKWLADYEAKIKLCLEEVRGVAEASFVKTCGEFKDYTIFVTVFSYDKQFRTVKKSFGLGEDKMRGAGFRYGLGLPGLALKAKRLVFYDKNLIKRYKSIAHQRNGIFDVEHLDIEQESEDSVAVPLYCDADTRVDSFGKVTFVGRPYGVVKISFVGLNSHKALFDVSNSVVQADFAGAVCQIMYELVENAILAPGRGR
ncbi:MAG TPA: metallophosphoesterase [Telluria sp.]|nr:metallophosphoesterase [Telluria sp.]